MIDRTRSSDLVERLDDALFAGGFQGTVRSLADGESWCIGTHDILFSEREIFNGHMQPVYRCPLIRQVPERVIAYLIAIGGEKDLLNREHHDFVGWHYHYQNPSGQRSDVILSWDTRFDAKHSQRGIFWEKHAEKAKRFSARPNAWSERKRKSIYAACAPDLGKWEITKFRNAADNAQPVWPEKAVLTARGTRG